MKFSAAVGVALTLAGPIGAQSPAATGSSEPCGLATAPMDSAEMFLTATVRPWRAKKGVTPVYTDSVARAIGRALALPAPLPIPAIALSGGRGIPAMSASFMVTATKTGDVATVQAVTSSLNPDLDFAIFTAVVSAGAAHALPAFDHGMRGDSIALLLTVRMDSIPEEGRVTVLRRRLPVWTPETVAHPRPGNPRPSYPPLAYPNHVGDSVTLEFVVDTSGRVDLGSERVLDGHYSDYIAAATHALARSLFVPARVAGCAVPQFMRQTYRFEPPSPRLDPADLIAARRQAPGRAARLAFDSLGGEQPPIVLRYGACDTMLFEPVAVAVGERDNDPRWGSYRNHVWTRFAMLGALDTTGAFVSGALSFIVHRDGHASEMTAVDVPPSLRLVTIVQDAVVAATVATALLGPFPDGVAADSILVRLSWGMQSREAQTMPRLVCEPAALPGNRSPSYPSDLRDRGVQGRVMAQFVMDTAGRAVPSSIAIVQSTDPGFSGAVCNVLPGYHFVPASIDGRPIYRLVQQPFEFTLPGRGPPPDDSATAGTRSVPRS